MTRLPAPLSVFLALCLTVGAVQARMVYRSIDTDGAEHFSDTPVKGAERVWVPDSVISGKANASAEAADTVDANGDTAAAAGPDTGQALAAMCKKKTDQLKSYVDAGEVVDVDASGKERVFTAAERNDLLVRTRADIKAVCGK